MTAGYMENSLPFGCVSRGADSDAKRELMIGMGRSHLNAIYVEIKMIMDWIVVSIQAKLQQTSRD